MIMWILLIATVTGIIILGLWIRNQKNWPLTATLLRKRGSEWIITTSKARVTQEQPGRYIMTTKKPKKRIPVPSLEYVKPNNTVIMAEVERDQWIPADVTAAGTIKIIGYDHTRDYADEIRISQKRYVNQTKIEKMAPYLLIAMLFVGFGIGMYLFWQGMNTNTQELAKASQAISQALQHLAQAQNHTPATPPATNATW